MLAYAAALVVGSGCIRQSCDHGSCCRGRFGACTTTRAWSSRRRSCEVPAGERYVTTARSEARIGQPLDNREGGAPRSGRGMLDAWLLSASQCLARRRNRCSACWPWLASCAHRRWRSRHPWRGLPTAGTWRTAWLPWSNGPDQRGFGLGTVRRGARRGWHQDRPEVRSGRLWCAGCGRRGQAGRRVDERAAALVAVQQALDIRPFTSDELLRPDESRRRPAEGSSDEHPHRPELDGRQRRVRSRRRECRRVPNAETGVGIGASDGEPTTFEPEEPNDTDEGASPSTR
jgi:hypothetical protein